MLLVASPELVPRLSSVWNGLRRLWRKGSNAARHLRAWLQGLFGKEAQPKRIELNLSDSVGASDSVMALHGPPAGDTEKLIDFLIRRDRANQERFHALEKRIGELPSQWRSDIEAQSGRLRTRLEDTVRDLEERHIRARLFGLLLLVIGIVLNTWGNLL